MLTSKHVGENGKPIQVTLPETGSASEVNTNLEVSITGEDVISAYNILKGDLDALVTDDPDRQVEFTIGNITTIEWKNLGTALYAGEWVRGANPTEPLPVQEAIGGAVESDGGGAGSMLSFYAADPNSAGEYYVLCVFGYCPKTASNRVMGSFEKVSADQWTTITNDTVGWLQQKCDSLEDMGGSNQSYSQSVGDYDVVASYSGANQGLVECTIQPARS